MDAHMIFLLTVFDPQQDASFALYRCDVCFGLVFADDVDKHLATWHGINPVVDENTAVAEDPP